MTDYPYLDNTTADLRLIGAPNIMSSFGHFNSAPRVSMFNHHLPQTMVIDKPEFNKVFTGIEHHHLDYVFNTSKRDYTCEILAVIPKYRPPMVSREICPTVYVIVLTLDEPSGEQRLDYFTVDRYFMGQNGFGWIPHIKNRHRVQVGEILDKETVITHSPAVVDNQYCLGTNLNTIYGSFPQTIEDAFVISESAAKKLGTTHIEKKIISCRMDRQPLNLNGNEYEDKFLPDIGQMVRADGALCAFRPIHWTTVVADSDPEALREPLPLQDDIIYIEPGSRILDLTFNINRSKVIRSYEQALRYQNNNSKCWEDIYSIYLKYKGKHKLTPKMSTLVTTSIYRMIAQGVRIPSSDMEFQKAAKNPEIEGTNGHVVDFMEIEVTYASPRKVSHGTKLTDQGGSKK